MGDDPGTEASRGAFGEASLEDQADLLGATQVKILADDLFEQVAPRERTVEHLGAGELRLQDGELIAIARVPRTSAPAHS